MGRKMSQEGGGRVDAVAPSDLVPWPGNPRINHHAVSTVAQSILDDGWGAPVVARRSDRRIIAGHTRVKAALSLGLESIPVHWVDVDDATALRMSVRDNKLGELAWWDPDLLAALDADLGALGFTAGELKDLSAATIPGREWTGGSSEPLKRGCSVALHMYVHDVHEFEDLVFARCESGETMAETLLRLLRAAR